MFVATRLELVDHIRIRHAVVATIVRKERKGKSIAPFLRNSGFDTSHLKKLVTYLFLSLHSVMRHELNVEPLRTAYYDFCFQSKCLYN